MSNTPFIPQVTAPESSSKDFPKLPAGTYVSRIIQIIDLGTQINNLDTTKPPERKLRFVFETVDELFEFSKEKGEQPFTVDKEVPYKISNPKADKISGLTTIIEAVNGNREDKNVFNLIGKLVQINTTLSDSGYPKIGTFSGLPKALKNVEYPEFNPLHIFWIENWEETKNSYEIQPQFVKDKIALSPEWKNVFTSNKVSDPLEKEKQLVVLGSLIKDFGEERKVKFYEYLDSTYSAETLEDLSLEQIVEVIAITKES
jgi:hypothetical protein